MVMLFVAVVMTANAMAQIPANVKEVLKKSDEKMASFNTPAGVSMDAKVKMKVSVLSMDGTIKMYEKNKKFFANMSIKGPQDIRMNIELGFDGQQKWQYQSLGGGDGKDTLMITKTRDAINSFGVRSGYDKEYKNAKMKESDRFYEITFSGPLKKDIPKKSTIKIAKDSYILSEYSVVQNMGPLTGNLIVTITKITKRCNDNSVKLDMNRYKNAVVVRR